VIRGSLARRSAGIDVRDIIHASLCSSCLLHEKVAADRYADISNGAGSGYG
jgi:hypothetical protein